jgi:hypothetical protein
MDIQEREALVKRLQQISEALKMGRLTPDQTEVLEAERAEIRKKLVREPLARNARYL